MELSAKIDGRKLLVEVPIALAHGEDGELAVEVAPRVQSDPAPERVAPLISAHFAPHDPSELTVAERTFPYRMRPDLQRAIEELFADGESVDRFCGVRCDYAPEGLTFSTLLGTSHYVAVVSPPEYEEVDVGESRPVRCLRHGLWLLRSGDQRYAVLLTPATRYGDVAGTRFFVAVPGSPGGLALIDRFFDHLESRVQRARCYRGKILSLEGGDSYSGASAGIRVHKLRRVDRDDVILPRKTLALLDRNVIGFARHSARLAEFGLSTRKGLLFYGPPGNGKTHTIHYLAGALEGHTTFLISAEQVGLLSEYMTLARLLQPSVVVMEDVDLIARERTQMSSPCEEVLLNKLLNEMDGLKEDARVLFLLTTNRPEALEAALASRPGRVDQAIEFPLPDDEGREKLVRLYAGGVELTEPLVRTLVQRTDRCSAALIKELLRRSIQFHLERTGRHGIELEDVEGALEEMLFAGGALNLKLLGGHASADAADEAAGADV